MDSREYLHRTLIVPPGLGWFLGINVCSDGISWQERIENDWATVNPPLSSSLATDLQGISDECIQRAAARRMGNRRISMGKVDRNERIREQIRLHHLNK